MASVDTETPLLADGMRLPLEEFLRRWEQMPEVKFAELINGVVRMPSPVSDDYSSPHGVVAGLAFAYQAATPGCRLNLDGTYRLGPDLPQPDVALRLLPEYGGRATIGADRLVYGPPEFAAEVSLSSALKDLTEKHELYRTAGIPEYLVVLPTRAELRLYQLRGGDYHTKPADAGVLKSDVFPGLWFDTAAVLALDAAAAAAAVQRGLASAEHAAFVQQLRARRAN